MILEFIFHKWSLIWQYAIYAWKILRKANKWLLKWLFMKMRTSIKIIKHFCNFTMNQILFIFRNNNKSTKFRYSPIATRYHTIYQNLLFISIQRYFIARYVYHSQKYNLLKSSPLLTILYSKEWVLKTSRKSLRLLGLSNKMIL